jgi:hypothetical protein
MYTQERQNYIEIVNIYKIEGWYNVKVLIFYTHALLKDTH